MSFTTSQTASRGLRRLAATLGALVAGAALAFGTAAPAAAAQNIDPAETGSIAVHKFQEPADPSGLPNNGTQLPDTTGLVPIEGITFTLQQVDVDLANAAAWQGLEDYTVAEAQADLVEGSDRSLATGADGVAVFDKLPLGLYLATETNVGANRIALKGEPFLVTMPLALNNGWLYDVHVYPKNTVTALVKDINDSDAQVIGDPIAFILSAQVPSLPAASALSAFGITDTLDARLRYASATVAVDGLALVPADYAVTAANQNVTLSFTPEGLAKLRTVQGNKVTLTLDTTIQALGDGAIQNTAAVFINDPKNSFDSNTVTSSWGALTLVKFAAGDPTKVLGGAEFALYAKDARGNRVPAALKDVTDGDTTFTTDASGTFTINGLKAGDYELVETKAPLGYLLDAKPVAVTVVQGEVAGAATMRVSNTQVPAFELPLTGSTGIALFVGAGVLLLGTGITLATVAKRKSIAAAARS